MQAARKRRKMERRREEKEEREEKKGKKGTKRDRTKEEQRKVCPAFSGCTLFSFFIGVSLPFSLQPLVHEADERDHVGPFVSRFPISVCTPEDHDEVGLRSSSTKDGTLCPV